MISSDVKEGYEKWKAIKFADVKQTLQAKCNEVANLQEESEASRKRLIEMSREFKRTTDESVRNQVAPLMKYFQKEIDSLLHRSKTGESCLLELLQNFVPLPSPDKLISALFHTIDALKEDVKTRDRTILQLKVKTEELEDLNSKAFTQRWEERENNLRFEVAENENILKDEILLHQNEISKLKETIEKMNNSREQAGQEIIDLRNKHELELTARGQEVELLLNDQEKLQNQLGNALAKNDASLDHNIAFQPQNKLVSELEQDLICKENEIDLLSRKIIGNEQLLSDNNKTHTNQISDLNTQILRFKNRVFELENLLKNQEDYHEIKQELSTLKMIEFGSSKEDEVSNSAEKLLATKNKQLQTQCTKLRTENGRLNDESQNLELSLQNANTKITKYEKQIEQLEQDIIRLQQLLPPRPEVEGISTPANTDLYLSSNDFLTELVQNQQIQQSTSNEKDHGLISILLSQRERLKEKHLALQHDFDTVKHQSNELQIRISTLEHDNMRLYEKIRFLQSYPHTSQSHILPDKSLQRYSHDYESKLDPFTAFNRKEIFSRYSRMPGTDRAIFNIGKVILSNRITRRLALFYLLIVHILLFVGIYFYTTYEMCRVNAYAECLRSFEEHMQVHHSAQ
ncbi:Protein CASP isoform X2 [Oopsacas minuta]|uniref:Protein CASP n=1 Tax=Oopsacas minuta TaxID=111878 RepID=A0AAV7JEK7_9METZ|nr:Protein CASP isoform X2 [Oopsacas minuta]